MAPRVDPNPGTVPPPSPELRRRRRGYSGRRPGHRERHRRRNQRGRVHPADVVHHDAHVGLPAPQALSAVDCDDLGRGHPREPGWWSVTNKTGETLAITLTEVLSDTSVDLGIDPGLVKDGVGVGVPTKPDRLREPCYFLLVYQTH